jgi:hypothetical protein
MSTNHFPKQPAEKFAVSLDFGTNRFNGTEAYASESTTSVLLSTGVSSTTTVIDSTSESGDIITIIVKAGNAGENHKITCLVTTDEANIYESEVMMKVRAI